MDVKDYFKQQKGITVDSTSKVGGKYTALDMCEFARSYHKYDFSFRNDTSYRNTGG